MAHDIAERLLKAHAERRQLASSELSPPADVAEVYRIQYQVYARLASGVRPNAWKVGGPSADVEPMIAPILPGRVLTSPATVNARDFHVIGVEAEIAFRITDATPQAVVAIELCDSRLADWQSASALWKLADNQMNWGLVLGTGTARWQEIERRTRTAIHFASSRGPSAISASAGPACRRETLSPLEAGAACTSPVRAMK